MNQFEHRDLDGTWARLLTDGTLEMRDPNDGQDPDPAAKSRYQYRVVAGVLHRRRLPPQALGDVWRGADAPDPFIAVDAWPPIPGILDAFWRYHGGDPARFALDGAVGTDQDDTLPMESPPHCVACSGNVKAGDGHRDVDLQGETFRLCAACWSKVRRGGRSARQTVEAVLLSYDPDFGGPDDPCDHEDYRDLELLGLWPDGEG